MEAVSKDDLSPEAAVSIAQEKGGVLTPGRAPLFVGAGGGYLPDDQFVPLKTVENVTGLPGREGFLEKLRSLAPPPEVEPVKPGGASLADLASKTPESLAGLQTVVEPGEERTMVRKVRRGKEQAARRQGVKSTKAKAFTGELSLEEQISWVNRFKADKPKQRALAVARTLAEGEKKEIYQDEGGVWRIGGERALTTTDISNRRVGAEAQQAGVQDAIAASEAKLGDSATDKARRERLTGLRDDIANMEIRVADALSRAGGIKDDSGNLVSMTVEELRAMRTNPALMASSGISPASIADIKSMMSNGYASLIAAEVNLATSDTRDVHGWVATELIESLPADDLTGVADAIRDLLGDAEAERLLERLLSGRQQ
jgi:hypothetical protein|tara:strand:- start:501 stop:1616 length:1116 start_codon:yes stop_codon:yes gene_type:complete